MNPPLKYNDPNIVPSNTIGLRFTKGDNMCLCGHGVSLSEFKVTASANSIAKGPKATAQRHMLSPKVTLNTMVSVGTMLGSRYLKQSDYMFIKYNDPNMVPTDTMGFRVNLRENMCLCTHGLVLSDFKLTSSG